MGRDAGRRPIAAFLPSSALAGGFTLVDRTVSPPDHGISVTLVDRVASPPDDGVSEDRPLRKVFSAALLFCDISGFTALSEALKHTHAAPAEALAAHLNSYLSLIVKTLAAHGGDLIKFAGDAALVAWPIYAEQSAADAVRAAGQAALSIQTALHRAVLAPGVVLSVKIGVALGRVALCCVGGLCDRWEVFVTGPAVAASFAAQQCARGGGETWLTRDAFAALHVLLRSPGEESGGAARHLPVSTLPPPTASAVFRVHGACAQDGTFRVLNDRPPSSASPHVHGGTVSQLLSHALRWTAGAPLPPLHIEDSGGVSLDDAFVMISKDGVGMCTLPATKVNGTKSGVALRLAAASVSSNSAAVTSPAIGAGSSEEGAATRQANRRSLALTLTGAVRALQASRVFSSRAPSFVHTAGGGDGGGAAVSLTPLRGRTALGDTLPFGVSPPTRFPSPVSTRRPARFPPAPTPVVVELDAMLPRLLPGALVQWVDAGKAGGWVRLEHAASHVRPVAVLFVDLGVPDSVMLDCTTSSDALHDVHALLRTVQRVMAAHRGSLNKFLWDDKGATLLAVFGGPPDEGGGRAADTAQHPAVDAVQCAIATLAAVREHVLAQGSVVCRPSAGVTHGAVYVGIVGGTNRREYSILGDAVNTAARLMSCAGHAYKAGVGAGWPGVPLTIPLLVDSSAARHASACGVALHPLPPLHVKGKADLLSVYASGGQAGTPAATPACTDSPATESLWLVDPVETMGQHARRARGQAGDMSAQRTRRGPRRMPTPVAHGVRAEEVRAAHGVTRRTGAPVPPATTLRSVRSYGARDFLASRHMRQSRAGLHGSAEGGVWSRLLYGLASSLVGPSGEAVDNGSVQVHTVRQRKATGRSTTEVSTDAPSLESAASSGAVAAASVLHSHPARLLPGPRGSATLPELDTTTGDDAQTAEDVQLLTVPTARDQPRRPSLLTALVTGARRAHVPVATMALTGAALQCCSSVSAAAAAGVGLSPLQACLEVVSKADAVRVMAASHPSTGSIDMQAALAACVSKFACGDCNAGLELFHALVRAGALSLSAHCPREGEEGTLLPSSPPLTVQWRGEPKLHSPLRLLLSLSLPASDWSWTCVLDGLHPVAQVVARAVAVVSLCCLQLSDAAAGKDTAGGGATSFPDLPILALPQVMEVLPLLGLVSARTRSGAPSPASAPGGTTVKQVNGQAERAVLAALVQAERAGLVLCGYVSALAHGGAGGTGRVVASAGYAQLCALCARTTMEQRLAVYRRVRDAGRHGQAEAARAAPFGSRLMTHEGGGPPPPLFLTRRAMDTSVPAAHVGWLLVRKAQRMRWKAASVLALPRLAPVSWKRRYGVLSPSVAVLGGSPPLPALLLYTREEEVGAGAAPREILLLAGHDALSPCAVLFAPGSPHLLLTVWRSVKRGVLLQHRRDVALKATCGGLSAVQVRHATDAWAEACRLILSSTSPAAHGGGAAAVPPLATTQPKQQHTEALRMKGEAWPVQASVPHAACRSESVECKARPGVHVHVAAFRACMPQSASGGGGSLIHHGVGPWGRTELRATRHHQAEQDGACCHPTTSCPSVLVSVSVLPDGALHAWASTASALHGGGSGWYGCDDGVVVSVHQRTSGGSTTAEDGRVAHWRTLLRSPRVSASDMRPVSSVATGGGGHAWRPFQLSVGLQQTGDPSDDADLDTRHGGSAGVTPTLCFGWAQDHSRVTRQAWMPGRQSCQAVCAAPDCVAVAAGVAHPDRAVALHLPFPHTVQTWHATAVLTITPDGVERDGVEVERAASLPHALASTAPSLGAFKSALDTLLLRRVQRGMLAEPAATFAPLHARGSVRERVGSTQCSPPLVNAPAPNATRSVRGLTTSLVRLMSRARLTTPQADSSGQQLQQADAAPYAPGGGLRRGGVGSEPGRLPLTGATTRQETPAFGATTLLDGFASLWGPIREDCPSDSASDTDSADEAGPSRSTSREAGSEFARSGPCPKHS